MSGERPKSKPVNLAIRCHALRLTDCSHRREGGGRDDRNASKEVPKVAANDRSKATAEEATGIVASAIAYYGTYAVNEADKTLLVKIAGSTYANLVGGSPQKRIITSLTDDELRFTNPRTPAGVTLQTVWRRARSE